MNLTRAAIDNNRVTIAVLVVILLSGTMSLSGPSIEWQGEHWSRNSS